MRDGGRGLEASYGSIVEDNRVFHNTGIGLVLYSDAVNRNNKIYDNDIGIYTDLGYAGIVSNNFLVNNITAGVLVAGTGYYGGTPTITQNTIVQDRGDAIRVVDGRAQNVLVKNNILQVSSGYALNIDSASGRGFRSDYNVIHVRGTGKIGLWEGVTFTNAADWFYDVGLDQSSYFGDPSSWTWTVPTMYWALVEVRDCRHPISPTIHLAERHLRLVLKPPSASMSGEGLRSRACPQTTLACAMKVICIYPPRAVTPSTRPRMTVCVCG